MYFSLYEEELTAFMESIVALPAPICLRCGCAALPLYCSVVDVDVVDQAEPVAPGLETASGTDAKAAFGSC
jgi:hypothetical protein